MESIEWKNLNWLEIDKHIRKLQDKIYKSSLKNDKSNVMKYQQLLINSYFAKLKAIRIVTQDNCGRNTAGVDGVKSLTPKQRLKLATTLKVNGKANKIRRVYIPKAGSNKGRPLGIPTMIDRAKQALVKMALEPEWEAKFEPNSYGFRPGRSTHDAIEAAYKSINRSTKFILDADISKCFDSISHSALIKKLDTTQKISEQIRAWLKAGILEPGTSLKETPENTKGTPQGGVLSPLLSNIALHGIEFSIKSIIQEKHGVRNARSLTIVRYADDIRAFHPKKDIILEVKLEMEKFIAGVGLEFNENKTKILHTLEICDGQIPGCDFLGFNIRQYYVGKKQKGKKQNPFKTLIKPSKKSVIKHMKALKEELNKLNTAPAIVEKLNPRILGWANYFKSGVSSKIFSYCDHILLKYILSRIGKIHSTRGKKWLFKKYFAKIKGYKWSLVYYGRNKKVYSLQRHTNIKIVRHTKVQGNKTPFDNDIVYWIKRRSKRFNTSPTLRHKILAQEGKCAICKGLFKVDEKIELDHVIPKTLGGKLTINNIQAVHKHCHHIKTAKEMSKAVET